jgi:hypothetical protein
MAFNEYHFVTVWRVEGTIEEVAKILTDRAALTRWWPSVYLSVEERESGDANGLGKVIDLWTKGWLPYTLRWRLRVSEIGTDSFTLTASGDFVGRGIWTFAQEGPWAIVTYDWQIRAEKPLLRYLTPLLKPIFAANHRWAMTQGEHSLKLELARRRATTPEERARIPPPPAPTTTSSLPLLAGVAAVIGIVGLGLRRRVHWATGNGILQR